MFLRSKRKDPQPVPDEELIARYKETGDRQLVGILFERYTQLSFLVCMKYLKDEDESKDAVMQVFEKMLSDLMKYEVRTFSHWLHRVLKNHCLALLDKKQRERKKTENYYEDHDGFMESGPDNDLSNEAVIREVRIGQLELAMKELNDQQKLCVELFYLQRKSYKEVSDITGFEMKEVKSYIQNGKRNLKIHLSKMMRDE
jgi:RNA polymerase sigma-70 factor (ECF subfamily)